MKYSFQQISQSLSLKLGLGILGIVFTVFTFSMGFLYVRSRQLLKQEAEERATQTLNTITLRVSGYISEVEAAANTTEWFVMQNLNPDSLLNYTHRVVANNPHVNGCSVTMEPGFFPELGRNFSAYSLRNANQIETVIEAEYDYYSKPWYKSARDLNKPCWVEPYNDFTEGSLSSPVMIASYSKPLHNEKGQIIGVLSTDLSMALISEVIKAEKPYLNSYCMMLGSDGRYYVHPDRLKLLKHSIFSSVDAKKHPDIVTLGHEMTARKTGNMSIHMDGAPCLVFYQPIPNTTCSLALVCPEKDIFESYYRLTYILITLLVVGLALLFYLCWKIIGHVTRPLMQLASQSRHIANGNFESYIPRSQRIDVVGYLQNSFASMHESILEKIDNIQRMNDEAEKRNHDLAAANELAQEADQRKTAFIHEISLQIRTPLNIIAGFMQVLSDTHGQLSEEERKNMIATMKQNTRTIYRMAHMIYDSSRAATIHQGLDCSKEVEVLDVINESIQDFEEKPPLNVDFHFENRLPEHKTIHTNRLYFHRSIRELLYNTKKFAADSKITLIAEETPEMIRIIVEDTGPGIAPEDRERVFEPFVKLNNFDEGLGLGLGLSTQHAQNLGGSLSLDPSYTLGARFVLEIPNK